MLAGRIMDFVESGKLVLSGVKFFVLDEADRLLDTGNQGTIMKLYNRFPKAGHGTQRLQVQPCMWKSPCCLREIMPSCDSAATAVVLL